jgi:CubicO group peptidase (beta-lactamase class C family)
LPVLCHHRVVFTVKDQADGAADLEARLASFLEQHRLPGGVAGVVRGDELTWLAGAGFAGIAAGTASDPAMLYGIASVTKTFTGTAVMQLRDAGRLDLDDPAVRWLPELRQLASPFGSAKAVTIRRMLSHESGLPAEPPGTDWSVPAYQGDPGQTLRQAAGISVQFPPHARHQYSDLAYQWLGEIITRASGIPYPRYVREAILDPLGMTATGFGPLPAETAARCATGYQWRALSDYLDPAPPMPPVWAEGGLWSSAEDLARWVSFQLRAYRDPAATAPVLDAASLRAMHKPRYLADDQWTRAYGISWRGTRRDDTVWIGHAGGIPGFTSAICFDPAAQIGAVVLFNGTSTTADLAMDLAALARRQAPNPAPPGTPPAPAPENYRPLLGIYARPGLGGWLLRLEWTRGNLVFTTAEAPYWQIILTPAAVPDQFTIADGDNLPGQTVTFRRLADGRVASVHLMDSTWIRLDPITT